MKDHYDFSNAVRNPFADVLIKEGYTIRVHRKNGQVEELKVSPEDIERITPQSLSPAAPSVPKP